MDSFRGFGDLARPATVKGRVFGFRFCALERAGFARTALASAVFNEWRGTFYAEFSGRFFPRRELAFRPPRTAIKQALRPGATFDDLTFIAERAGDIERDRWKRLGEFAFRKSGAGDEPTEPPMPDDEGFGAFRALPVERFRHVLFLDGLILCFQVFCERRIEFA